MAKRKTRKLRALVFLVALVGIFILWTLVKRVQVLRSDASIPGNIGEVKASAEQYEGDLQKVSLSFHTGVDEGNSEIVSYLGFRLEVPLEGGLVLLTNESGAQADEINVTEEFSDEDTWAVPVNKIYADENNLYVDFALVNLTKEGFKSHELVKFADFYVQKGVVPVEIELNVNKDFSFMYTKDRPVVNIWEPPNNLVIIR